MKNPFPETQTAYYPSDLLCIVRNAQLEFQLCNTGLQHYIKILDNEVILIIKGISRVDGQSKTITVSL